MKIFNVLSALMALLLLAANARAATIADWTFETTSASITGTSSRIGPIAADTGTGSATGSHASSSTAWGTPVGNGSAHSFSVNQWGVGDYFQFEASTIGYMSVAISWDQTSTTTGPRDWVLQYSLDGTSFTTSGSQYTVGSTAFSFGVRNEDLNYTRSGFSNSLDNAPNVYFRLVDNSTFGNNVNTPTPPAATDRLDNVVLSATPVPEPATLVLGIIGLGMAGGAVAFRRFHIKPN